MADYKDIIMGTLKTVAGKVKDIAENETVRGAVGGAVEKVRDFAESSGVRNVVDGAVEKVRDFAESKGVGELYTQGTGKAKFYGSIAKLRLEISGESEELERSFAEIGRLCYEQGKDAPEALYAPLFAKVAELESSIQQKEEYINSLRTEKEAEADIEVEVVVDEEENVAEELKAEAEEVVREASEVFADAAEEAFEDVVENTEKDGSGQE